jgi:hypothetical protein
VLFANDIIYEGDFHEGVNVAKYPSGLEKNIIILIKINTNYRYYQQHYHLSPLQEDSSSFFQWFKFIY